MGKRQGAVESIEGVTMEVPPCASRQLKDHYKGRRVLVTGSTGFKGAWLCRMLTLLGAEVTGYALTPPTEPSLWDIADLEAGVDQRMADIRDLEALRKVFTEAQPQTVLHLAAQPLVIDSYDDPLYTYETNVMGTVNVLECVRTTESVESFLNVTTDKVYENLERPGYGCRKDDKLDGFDPYSNSKSCSELVTHSYAKSFFAPGSHGAAAGRRSVHRACGQRDRAAEISPRIVSCQIVCVRSRLAMR